MSSGVYNNDPLVLQVVVMASILSLHKKWNRRELRGTADLVTFTEEILNGKLRF